MMPSRAEKAALKAAAEWERKAKDEYQKDLQNPERIKERQAEKNRTEFLCKIGYEADESDNR